uniref:Uncharacterized protein n=1 Tax=Arundo donax TaxID=35708 RepID=A0A0A8YUS5_ARUDO
MTLGASEFRMIRDGRIHAVHHNQLELLVS